MAVGSKRTSEVSERMSERSGGRERSEQSGASERVSGASERANGRASGPVLQSVFLAVIDHSGREAMPGSWAPSSLSVYRFNLSPHLNSQSSVLCNFNYVFK